MKHRMTFKLAVCALLVFAFPSLYAQMPQPFSADMASSSPNGAKMNGKIYSSPPNYRMDMTAAEGGGKKGGPQNVSMITDGSSQTTYMVMHDQHMYMEIHANQQNPFMRQAPFMPHDFNPNDPCVWARQKGNTCKKLGTETVNGRVCDKYQGVSSDGKTTGTGWIDQKLHYPIKFVSSDGATWDLTNIKEGRPDASFFQPPADYRKMDLGGMMGGQRPH